MDRLEKIQYLNRLLLNEMPEYREQAMRFPVEKTAQIYSDKIERLQEALDRAETVVTGHGPVSTAKRRISSGRNAYLLLLPENRRPSFG